MRLVVTEAEQERRIGNPDRTRFHKLTELETLRGLRRHRDGIEQPPVDLEIDTDHITAEQSAALIAVQFQLTPQQRTQRYPRPE